MDEDEIIATLFAPLAGEGADGLRDDAAFLAPGAGMVVTTDALSAGVHFFADDPPEAIAAKALRVNLSDLVAKGAEPFAYLLALALPACATREWVARFADGLADEQARTGIMLLGGDTLRASPGGGLTLTVTAFGHAKTIVRRRTARPGEVILVTGTIGDAALGLLARLCELPAGVRRGDAEALRQAYLWPSPPLGAGPAVRAHASAAMDVSDGLLGDLAKLLAASGVGAEVDVDRVPLSDAVRAVVAIEPSAFDRAMTGGDDYQTLATVPGERVAAYRAALGELGLRATVIGHTHVTPGLALRRNGAPWDIADGRFRHF